MRPPLTSDALCRSMWILGGLREVAPGRERSSWRMRCVIRNEVYVKIRLLSRTKAVTVGVYHTKYECQLNILDDVACN